PRASCAGSTWARSTTPSSPRAWCRCWTASGWRHDRHAFAALSPASRVAAGGAAAGAGHRHGAGRARRGAAAVPGCRRGAPLQRAGLGTALRDVPEPVAGRFQRADRPRPAPRGLRADAQRPQRRRDPQLPGRALRRVRAVPAAFQRPHRPAVAGTGTAVAGRRAGGGAHRACTRQAPAAGRRGAGVVSVTLLYVVLVLAALAMAALVAAPLRRGAPRLFGAIVLLVPVMAFALYRIVGTPMALDAEAAAAAERAAPTMEQAVAEL